MNSVALTPLGELKAKNGHTIKNPLPVLGQEVMFQPGCTLRSILKLLENYPVLQELSEFLPDWVEEAAACPKSGCVCPEIRRLVVGRTTELCGFPGAPTVTSYLWLQGIGVQEPMENESKASESCAIVLAAQNSIRFIPLAMLLDTPLVLGGLKHTLLGDVNSELICDTRFTLFEVVDGLAWEFGFRGGTQQCNLER